MQTIRNGDGISLISGAITVFTIQETAKGKNVHMALRGKLIHDAGSILENEMFSVLLAGKGIRLDLGGVAMLAHSGLLAMLRAAEFAAERGMTNGIVITSYPSCLSCETVQLLRIAGMLEEK